MGLTIETPARCPVDVSTFPKLDHKQAGHLRHYHNLVSQPDGEWHHMANSDHFQEFDDALRYQLATMSYAAGAAHYHRLPALRGPFKQLMRRMIHKMLLRDVWGYWYNSSVGGKVFDPDFKELRRPWADPIVKENIMYSGHLVLMTSLYGMLFDDEEFEKPGSMVFRWNPLFWGLGPEEFVYDNRKLQKVILDQMEENGWVGVCCEPNAVFVVCNQFPIVAMRYNDSRDGTRVVEEVLDKYKAALVKKGMLSENGLYASFFAVKQGKAVAAKHGAHTAWANAFMNAWNPEFVRESYDKQTLGFLTNFDGKTSLHPTGVASAFRKEVLEKGADPNSERTLKVAQEESLKAEFTPKIPFETLNWLAFTMMLSELGKQKELNDLLDYADKHLNPQWEDGGFYYPLNLQLLDDNWNLTHIEPHSGNSGIGYARLNVEDGQRKMWEQPWTRELLAQRPWVDGAGYADGIDFLRGVWDETAQAMIITVKRWQTETRLLELNIRNLSAGQWAVYVNGDLKETPNLLAAGDVTIQELVGQDEVDLIVVRV